MHPAIIYKHSYHHHELILQSSIMPVVEPSWKATIGTYEKFSADENVWIAKCTTKQSF